MHWWAGYQVISSHYIDLIYQEYSDINTRTVVLQVDCQSMKSYNTDNNTIKECDLLVDYNTLKLYDTRMILS